MTKSSSGQGLDRFQLAQRPSLPTAGMVPSGMPGALPGAQRLGRYSPRVFLMKMVFFTRCSNENLGIYQFFAMNIVIFLDCFRWACVILSDFPMRDVDKCSKWRLPNNKDVTIFSRFQIFPMFFFALPRCVHAVSKSWDLPMRMNMVKLGISQILALPKSESGKFNVFSLWNAVLSWVW